MSGRATGAREGIPLRYPLLTHGGEQNGLDGLSR